MHRVYELPPWAAYAGFGLLNLAALGGLLIVIGLEGLAWLLLAWVCQRATRSYAAYRASLPEEPEEELKGQQPAVASEAAGACGPPLRLLVRPVLTEGTFVVVEPAEVYEPVRTGGS